MNIKLMKIFNSKLMKYKRYSKKQMNKLIVHSPILFIANYFLTYNN